jgi:hypothetical protein
MFHHFVIMKDILCYEGGFDRVPAEPAERFRGVTGFLRFSWVVLGGELRKNSKFGAPSPNDSQ